MLKYQPTPENLVHLGSIFYVGGFNSGILVVVEAPLTGQVNPADALSVLDLDLRNDPVLVVDKSLQSILK